MVSREGLKRSIVVATDSDCPFFMEDDRMLGPPECNLRDKLSCVGLNSKKCPLHNGIVEVRRATDYQ